MAEINFNTMFDQLSDLEKQQYEGVMGMGGFKSLYEQNPDSPLVTQNPNYEKFKEIADTQAQIPEESIMGMLNPFSSASASEVTPTNYSSNYDIASNMYTPEQQALIFGDPNYFGNQKFYKDTSVPVASIVDVNKARTAIEKAQQIQDQKLASENLINAAPDVFNINQLGDPALNPNSVNVFGLDPYGDNEDLIERGAVPEEGPIVGITDRNRGMTTTGAPTGAYEMIGGTPVAIGDVLGMQQALEKADFFEETPQGINYNNLGILGTIGGLLTGSTPLKMLGMFGNYKSGKTGRVFDSFSKGIGSLGSKIASRMRGINPITGKPNTQAQYEAARDARRTQNRIDYMLDRKAKGKSYSEKNLKEQIDKQIASREDKSGSGKKSGFTNPGTNSYGPHKGSGNDATRDGGCCFIMLESRYGDGTMDKVVRKYRDEKMTPRNRRGYYKMARVLVPLMRKSKVFKWIVAKTFADPLVSYGKWYYGENKHGWIFAPVKTAWLKIFDVVGTDTVFIRENGEEV